MKFTWLALSALSFATAHADLNSAVNTLYTNKKASFTVNTTTSDKPVEIELTQGDKSLEKIATAPELFVNAMQSKYPNKTIESGDNTYTLAWQKLTVQNHAAHAPARAIYDILADIKEHQEDPSFSDAKDRPGYLTENNRLLSVVGNYVAYYNSVDDYYPGAAHPNDFRGIISMNVASTDPNAPGMMDTANLLDIADEASLVQALKSDAFLRRFGRKHLRELNAATTVQTVSDALGDEFVAGCLDAIATDNKISGFAIYDYDKSTNLMSIRVSLTSSVHACAGATAPLQLGLKVKPLESFQYQVEAAALNNNGLLMKNSQP